MLVKASLDLFPASACIVNNTNGALDGLVVVHVNTRASERLAWLLDYINKPLCEVTHASEYAGIAKACLKLIKRETVGVAKSLGVVQDADGWFAIDARKVDATQAIISFCNVTEMAIQNIALQHAAKQANAMNEKFMRALAHDLKEPARTISQFTELLYERWHKLGDSQRENFLTRAHKSAVKLINMIDMLRSLVQEFNGNGNVPCKAVVDVIDDALDSVQLAADKKLATLSTVIDVPTDACISASFSNVIQNLLENSLKYAGDDPPNISLHASIDNNDLVVVVKDTGIGFDSRDASSIFEPFRRLFPQVEKAPGLGMGLAICKEIITQKNGRIWAYSLGPGMGATVTFRVPLHKTTNDQSPAC